MIHGYAEHPSPRAGGEVVLRVSTDAPEFRLELMRWGEAPQACGGTGWLPGARAPPHLPWHDWGRPNRGLGGEELVPWPAHRVPLPADLRPGVYTAVLIEGDGAGGDRTDPDRATPDGHDARALFVVRPPEGAPLPPILHKLPLFTWFAYTLFAGDPFDRAEGRGEWCLYNIPEPGDLPAPVPDAVSVRRPGGGTGAHPYDASNHDPFDATPRQTFVHWDAPLVAWLEREGYAVEHCTDLDLHAEGRDLLEGHRLLLCAGHDEYWSDAMRDAAEGWARDGGNIAFLSGNTAWWRIEFTSPWAFRRDRFWHEAGRPENGLTGVSFRNGGERDRDDHPTPVGFRVQHTGHWVFAGTGLRDGDVIGGGPDEYVVGYECDGADFDRADLDAGRAVRPRGGDGTPADFTILGVGDCRASGWGEGNGAATMGVHTPGGTVFTASTTDWPRVLAAGRSPAVTRITRNVLDRLGAPPGAPG